MPLAATLLLQSDSNDVGSAVITCDVSQLPSTSKNSLLNLRACDACQGDSYTQTHAAPIMGRELHLTWNTRLGLIWTALEFASVSIRAGDVLSAYLYLVRSTAVLLCS